ncbi:hypothetical protein B0T26DRAFT_205836 [Lasiosphaeria miniovina]|uniref:Uncharacterized protein n=1 Tax=Lasiosphaeria miniovina TaxID=1954250 RepID=A0AA40AUD3_9PEZI|nr:uncharacterized protein B0T26DRAFT_205836 [Lasiosphaeria miniovina]KAK0722169.1 hypothetical protein B0T26DRAFT_205836 [Lasiosphaeria miniovina]
MIRAKQRARPICLSSGSQAEAEARQTLAISCRTNSLCLGYLPKQAAPFPRVDSLVRAGAGKAGWLARWLVKPSRVKVAKALTVPSRHGPLHRSQSKTGSARPNRGPTVRSQSGTHGAFSRYQSRLPCRGGRAGPGRACCCGFLFFSFRLIFFPRRPCTAHPPSSRLKVSQSATFIRFRASPHPRAQCVCPHGCFLSRPVRSCHVLSCPVCHGPLGAPAPAPAPRLAVLNVQWCAVCPAGERAPAACSVLSCPI